MTGLAAILQKELKNLVNSDKGTFAVYAVISVVWSFSLLFDGGGIWLVFFSVIIAANFSATVFISERVSGTLEVLITSGVSRDAVLFGKMFFVIAMTSAMGAVCAALAFLWRVLLPDAGAARPLGLADAALYLGATVLNAAASAYLSARMGNPRFLHFVNLFMTGAAVAVYGAISSNTAAHPLILAAAFLLMGLAFAVLARREFAGERIIRPVIF
ncbi:MAG: ABC transporter permease subunit [Chitinispirillales bacterium]|jgi:ABC-type Na+ efflux pump permease subunit|nr:ABC transporter permease subunit [Chitinispirillales bacterium]